MIHPHLSILASNSKNTLSIQTQPVQIREEFRRRNILGIFWSLVLSVIGNLVMRIEGQGRGSKRTSFEWSRVLYILQLIYYLYAVIYSSWLRVSIVVGSFSEICLSACSGIIS
jgi:hypothetical protein